MTLYELNEKRMELFERYERGEITKNEYLKLVRPLDEAVDRIEMACLKGIGVLEKVSSVPSAKS
ncbi:hypothetical protein [Hydrogenimonas sp.]|uniref:hypothetical protein n=1 Tax=Hydrogenimonas sp. TaxID=2231112 RepID=UPI00261DBDAC|nr:hypothetical protein [Hydrogenimonas sp.]